MHEGVPPGGPIVPELMARANAGVLNSPGETAIEVFGSLTLRALVPSVVASDDASARSLLAGQAWKISSDRARVGYAAVRGGIEVARVIGGRGTLLVAGFGGHLGRPLRTGDHLVVGRAPECRDPPPAVPAGDSAIRLVPGPDLERFDREAMEVLLGSAFVVSVRSDRIGTRLVGPALVRADDDSAVSAPMVRGAIQVPVSGDPIVLGPDHPTTGGYPVIATVLRDDIGVLMARPISSSVRFALAPPV
jgi:allophanate hydrolase subunit 2